MTRAELDALIEEATVDAYNEHEQITVLFTMLDEHLAVPFDTELLGYDGGRIAPRVAALT